MKIASFRSYFKSAAIGCIALVGMSYAAFAEDFRVAIVMPGVITDKSFGQAGYEGVHRAAEELDIEFAYSEKISHPDQPQTLSDYARRGYDLVIGHGGEFQESIGKIAGRFPDTQFLIVNGVTPGANFATLSFDYTEMGYVMGFISGKTSESGIGGYIGAPKLKFFVELGEGYETGFVAARPDGKVLTTWTNDWDDVAKGKEAALNLINQGADVIFPSLDNAAIGSLQGAQEKGAMAIGIYYDAIVDWPNTVIQSAIFDLRSAMVDVITKAKAGELQNEANIYGIDVQEVTRIGTYSDRVPEAVRAEAAEVMEQIIAGEISTR